MPQPPLSSIFTVVAKMEASPLNLYLLLVYPHMAAVFVQHFLLLFPYSVNCS